MNITITHTITMSRYGWSNYKRMIFYKVSMSIDSQIILKSSLILDMNIVAIIPLLSVTQLNSNHEWAQTRAEEVYINNAMKREKTICFGHNQKHDRIPFTM